jgi:hypothetical protein
MITGNSYTGVNLKKMVQSPYGRFNALRAFNVPRSNALAAFAKVTAAKAGVQRISVPDRWEITSSFHSSQ